MANQVKTALADTIQRLHQQKWSQRPIAKKLQIGRETVASYLAQQEAAKPATAEGALSESKPATPGSPNGSTGKDKRT